MKGVSLAIETIIILILAVSVLTVLLFFLRSQVGPAQDTATLLREQTSACSAYVGADPACTDATDATAKAAAAYVFFPINLFVCMIDVLIYISFVLVACYVCGIILPARLMLIKRVECVGEISHKLPQDSL